MLRQPVDLLVGRHPDPRRRLVLADVLGDALGQDGRGVAGPREAAVISELADQPFGLPAPILSIGQRVQDSGLGTGVDRAGDVTSEDVEVAVLIAVTGQQLVTAKEHVEGLEDDAFLGVLELGEHVVHPGGLGG